MAPLRRQDHVYTAQGFPTVHPPRENVIIGNGRPVKGPPSGRAFSEEAGPAKRFCRPPPIAGRFALSKGLRPRAANLHDRGRPLSSSATTNWGGNFPRGYEWRLGVRISTKTGGSLSTRRLQPRDGRGRSALRARRPSDLRSRTLLIPAHGGLQKNRQRRVAAPDPSVNLGGGGGLGREQVSHKVSARSTKPTTGRGAEAQRKQAGRGGSRGRSVRGEENDPRDDADERRWNDRIEWEIGKVPDLV